MIIEVTCALIHKDGKILATQRSEFMSLPMKWEFPGGKIEPGETPEECLHREIAEELGVQIKILGKRDPVDHAYGEKTIRLLPFDCEIVRGKVVLSEHADYKWGTPEELRSLDLAEADVGVLDGVG